MTQTTTPDDVGSAGDVGGAPALVVGWVSDPDVNAAQVAHAVVPGHVVAACGALVTVLGGFWADPQRSRPLTRCLTCLRAARR